MNPESHKISSKECILRLCICSLVLIASPQIGFAEETDSSLKLLKVFRTEFVKVTPGTGKFPGTVTIGSKAGSSAEMPPVEHQLNESFEISKYEVYQNIYAEVMGANPSRWQGPRNSAERMTYKEAEEFCRRITKRLRKAQLISEKQLVRLPTEIEWEYCARAGTSTKYSFGDSATIPADQGKAASLLDPYGWHTGNAAGNDPAVGVLKPNPWGLYDIHGYLSEFCQGPWKESHNPEADMIDQNVPIRGGSWKDHFSLLTCSSRRPFAESGRDDSVGFRCVLAQEE